jgi:hypothetical protein
MMRAASRLLLAGALALGGTQARAYDLEIIGGTVHGPGPMPDTPLPTGRLGHVELDDRLTGISRFFNNGAEAPNNPYEQEFYGHLGGKLSNGVPFNEHVWGGIVTIGQGALRMFNVITGDGELHGTETYALDERLNWEIRTDLALDPGFPQGIVVSRNIKIFTGVLIVAPSLQTEGGFKGGLDVSGSLPSGAPVYGMLGDMDNRGFLDGRIVGVGRAPLGFLFVPGSPLVMEREVRSNIPVTHEQSGILTFAGLTNLRDILAIARDTAAPPAARGYVLANAKRYLEDFSQRAHSAQFHLASAGRDAIAAQAGEIEKILRKERDNAGGWAAAGAIPDASWTAILAALAPVDAALPALRSELRFPQLSGEGS